MATQDLVKKTDSTDVVSICGQFHKARGMPVHLLHEKMGIFTGAFHDLNKRRKKWD